MARYIGVLLAVVCVGRAQTSLTGGALAGTVSDSGGAVIPDARLTVRDIGTHQSRQASTDAGGQYRFAELPAGTYEVVLTQAGFAPYQHAGVTVPLGATVRVTRPPISRWPIMEPSFRTNGQPRAA